MEGAHIESKHVVSCPHCKYQYLLGEIFFPENVIGQPKNIIRDTLGNIIYTDFKDGKEMESAEKYYCDNCGKAFIAELDISVKSYPEEAERDFSSKTVKLF